MITNKLCLPIIITKYLLKAGVFFRAAKNLKPDSILSHPDKAAGAKFNSDS